MSRVRATSAAAAAASTAIMGSNEVVSLFHFRFYCGKHEHCLGLDNDCVTIGHRAQLSPSWLLLLLRFQFCWLAGWLAKVKVAAALAAPKSFDNSFPPASVVVVAVAVSGRSIGYTSSSSRSNWRTELS